MTTIHIPEQTIEGNGSIKFEIKVEPAPKQRYPLGKGILICNLNNNYLQTIDKLVGLGVEWVAPKIVNAVSEFNSQWNRVFIQECRKNGIDVWGWGYTYGVNSEKEGLNTAHILNDLDVSGYFIDAEGEYDQPNTTIIAQAYINNLRGNTQKPLGLCSFRYPSLHGNVPWKVLLDGCDFHIPQVYWIQATSEIAPGFQLGKSYNQLQAIKQLPFVALGTVVKDDGSPWVPTPNQITNFYNTAKQMNLPAYSYYDMDSALPNLLEVVRLQV